MRCSWYSKGILIGGAFFYSFYNLLLVNITHEIVECPPLDPKKLLQTYQTYSQLQQPFVNISREPLNWIDIKILTEPLQNFCESNVLFVIHSSPRNFEERAFLRNEIFAPIIKKGVLINAIFVLGFHADKNLYTKVSTEAFQFEDLLLLDVEEHYHNITHKARSWVKYIHEKCLNAYQTPNFIFKLDDDVSIDLPGFLKILESFKPFKNAVIGRVYSNGQIVRNPLSKWYLSKAEFPGHSLGVYCQGMAYAFSFSLLPKMYENLQKVQYLWMDDWYVTHALLHQTQAIYFDLQSHYISTDTLEDYQKLVEKKLQPGRHKKQRKKLLFGHFRPKSRFPLEKRKSAWKSLQQLHSCI